MLELNLFQSLILGEILYTFKEIKLLSHLENEEGGILLEQPLEEGATLRNNLMEQPPAPTPSTVRDAAHLLQGCSPPNSTLHLLILFNQVGFMEF